jgi:hypothetical protein
MESEVRRGALSSSCGDSTINISDPVSAEDDSDKEHKECVNQDEINNDTRENNSRNTPLGPQSLLQELGGLEQNGCVAAELNFDEGMSLLSIGFKMLLI